MKTNELWELFGDNILGYGIKDKYEYPWELIFNLNGEIYKIGATLGSDFTEENEGVWVHREAKIDKSARIFAPAIISKGAELRTGAFVRGGVILLDGALLGNSTEAKNSILFENAKLPHFNYVGDSILAEGVHLGAGAIISNVRGDKRRVRITLENEIIDTGLRKLGALIGKGVEIGSNSVINPGTVIDEGARIYPLSSVRGYVPKNAVYKGREIK